MAVLSATRFGGDPYTQEYCCIVSHIFFWYTARWKDFSHRLFCTRKFCCIAALQIIWLRLLEFVCTTLNPRLPGRQICKLQTWSLRKRRPGVQIHSLPLLTVTFAIQRISRNFTADNAKFYRKYDSGHVSNFLWMPRISQGSSNVFKNVSYQIGPISSKYVSFN